MAPLSIEGETTRGLSLEAIKNKLFSKKRSVNVSDYDPVYKVVYLGNVLTPWAKGDGCCDKPLATLWKNYCSNVKHDIYMKLTICNSGLKAITREHGLTEYWAHRITFSYAHPQYPRVFCWIYRHEGRKLKQELRCHAVLCSKESKAVEAANQLSARLVSALNEFRREKRMRQNTRLLMTRSQCHPPLPLESSCTDSAPSTDPAVMSSESTTSSSISSASSSSTSSSRSGSPSSVNSSSTCSSETVSIFHRRTHNNCLIPARKKHLVKGQANFRPPLERSKSAPRLTSIDELQEDEITDVDSTEDEVEEDVSVDVEVDSIEEYERKS